MDCCLGRATPDSDTQIASESPESSLGTMSATQALADGKPKKIVMVLYSGGEHAAKQPALLGCVEHALGLRAWLEALGHTVVATADKEGPECELERHLHDVDIIITT